VKVENQAALQDITSVVAIAGCYCTMEPYVDSKYDLYIQKIGSNYRTFVYVLPVLFVCCCLSRPTEASCDGSMLVDVTSGREVGAINWTQEPKSV